MVVFDLAALRLEWAQDRRAVTVWTPARRLLTTWALGEEQISDREAVFSALDHLLDSPVLFQERRCEVGLYNPFTGQVALRPVPHTSSYSDQRPVPLDAEGTLARLVDGELVIGDRILEALEPSFQAVTAAFAAHQG